MLGMCNQVCEDIYLFACVLEYLCIYIFIVFETAVLFSEWKCFGPLQRVCTCRPPYSTHISQPLIGQKTAKDKKMYPDV